jgi:signal transduction histidine kinase
MMSNSIEQDLAAIGGIRAIPTILDIVCRTTGMRFAAVARVTEDRWVACAVRDDIAFGLKPGGELALDTTICHEIRQSGQAVIIDHVAADERFRGHATPLLYGFQSYISAPIRLENGTFFGTLCAIDPDPHRLDTPETSAMFEMFAEVIGYHLSAIEGMQSAQTALSNEQAVAALREQFIAVLGHDLRNPLAAIQGGTQLLLKTPLTDKAATIANTMLRSVGRMGGLIDSVMDFARGRLGGGLTLQRNADEPIEAMINQVVDELRAAMPGRMIETRLAIDRPVNCDSRRLAQLISNLLGNALAYGAADRPVRVGADTSCGRFELSVANSGEPIAPVVLESIFQPFSRGSLRPSLQGLGLGLYIAHQIAVAHGGTLTVSSTPAETCFTFRMPLT